MKPRVLQLLTSLRPGGMERQTMQLTRELRDGGRYDVRVAALGGPGPLLDELHEAGFGRVPMIRLSRMYDPTAVAGTAALARMLRRERIGIVHTHDFYTNVVGMAAAVLARVPVRIASRREMDVFTPRQRRVERAFCSAASVVAANCEHLRALLIHEGVAAERVTVLRNAVDGDRLRREAGDPDPWLSLGLARGTPLVTMVANLHNTRKDPLTFVRAASAVAARRPDAVFVLAGAGESAFVHAHARTMVVAPRIVTPGLLLKPASLLAASAVVVLTSLSEGSPNTILEAMSLRRAVVATDVGGTNEMVEHGRSGYLCAPGDAEEAAAGICALLDQPDRADAFGARGAEIARSRFSPDLQSDAVHGLYDQLVRTRHG